MLSTEKDLELGFICLVGSPHGPFPFLQCPDLPVLLVCPGDTLYYRFTSDMSNTEWGYRFTVTAGHLGRFQTGVCAGPSVRMLSLPRALGDVGAVKSLVFVKAKADAFL